MDIIQAGEPRLGVSLKKRNLTVDIWVCETVDRHDIKCVKITLSCSFV